MPARAIMAPEQVMRAMERQTEIMRGEATRFELQSRKTMIEAIDQAQKLANQAQQVGAYSIRTGASLAQDWLTLTWQMWDVAAETLRTMARSGTRLPEQEEE